MPISTTSISFKKQNIKLPKRILIVKPSSLGDVVHSLPFLNALRERFPRAEIHWVIAKGLEELLEGHPMINRLWIINKDAWKKIKNLNSTIKELNVLFKELKKEKFDLAVDLQGLLRSGVLTAVTGAPVRVGFAEAREGSRFFYTHKIEGGKDIHAVDRYLKIACFLGCEIQDICFPLPLSFDLTFLTRHSLSSKKYAVIVPGARWKTKRWPPEKFGKLLSLLPIKSVIVGSKGDYQIANKIATMSNGKALSIAGKTDLKELIGTMKNARFIISNDSGPMHIAAALGIPVVALFGPTDPLKTGPYGKVHAIIKEDISCSPCFKKRCDDMQCMNDLSVEKVYEAIQASKLSS